MVMKKLVKILLVLMLCLSSVSIAGAVEDLSNQQDITRYETVNITEIKNYWKEKGQNPYDVVGRKQYLNDVYKNQITDVDKVNKNLIKFGYVPLNTAEAKWVLDKRDTSIINRNYIINRLKQNGWTNIENINNILKQFDYYTLSQQEISYVLGSTNFANKQKTNVVDKKNVPRLSKEELKIRNIIASIYLLVLLVLIIIGHLKYNEYNKNNKVFSKIKNNPKKDTCPNKSRDSIIRNASDNKINLIQLNLVLNHNGYDIMSVEECLTYCNNFKPITLDLITLDYKYFGFDEELFKTSSDYAIAKIKLDNEIEISRGYANVVAIVLVVILLIIYAYYLVLVFLIFLLPFYILFEITIVKILVKPCMYYCTIVRLFFNGRVKSIDKINYQYYLLYRDVSKLLDKKRTELLNLKKQEEFLKKENLRKYWKSLSPFAFEKKVAKLFQFMGYSATVTKATRDGGVDIILKKDNKITVVQCKAYKRTKKVSIESVRALWGTKDDHKANAAIFVTSSDVSSTAFEFIYGKNYKIYTLQDLVNLSIECNFCD